MNEYQSDKKIATLSWKLESLQKTSVRQSEMLALALREKNDLLQEKADLNDELKFTEQALQAARLNRFMPPEPVSPKPKFRIGQIVASVHMDGSFFRFAKILEILWSDRHGCWKYRTTSSELTLPGETTLEKGYRALTPEEQKTVNGL